MQKEAGIDDARMDELLLSHVIDPGRLRADDFKGFFEARERALLQRIEKAMGKPIATNIASIDMPAADDGDADEAQT
jgi:hypothetical protein